jgi:bacteriocin biosynthesis cyclodehydratase domain-containing protein
LSGRDLTHRFHRLNKKDELVHVNVSRVIARPRLRRHLSAKVIDPTLVVLLSDVDHWTFTGRVYPRIIPLLDGTRTVARVAQELSECANVAEVYAALMILERSGFLTDAEREPTRAPSRPSVVSFGAAGAVPAIQILDTLAGRAHAAPDTELTFVLTDDYLRREVADFAVQAEESGRAWLPIKIGGTVTWVGPLVHPPATPCWCCLLARIRANRPAHAWLESLGSLPTPDGDETSPSVLLALHTALLQTLKREPTAYESRATLISVNPTTLESVNHVVVRQPGCLRCTGTGTRRHEQQSTSCTPILLKSRRRIRRTDGGWRTVSPEETYRRYKHHVSDVTGIVRDIRRHTPRSDSVDLYTAEHLFTPSHGEPFLTGRRRSAGKGMSRMQARTSALCEALERYSGVFRGDERRIRTSREALGPEAIHPNGCANFSVSQFDAREAWNAASSPFNWVPVRFNDGCDIDWSPVWSLTEASVRYVPTAYCYYGYRTKAGEEFCRADSNGCAAGNTIEEAILQGFLELVERDAVAIWWYNELPRPAIELATFSQPFFEDTLAQYRSVGRSLQVLDLTTDLEIPVVAAVSEFLDPAKNGLLLGFGAHFDAEAAIARALTELNQWKTGFDLGMAASPFSHGTGTPGAFLRDGPAPSVHRESFEPATFDDIRDGVEACVARAARCGLNTLVLDQTREDVGLPVVRVIVPGLRHFWPRFGPGRLYAVPVALGWVQAPKSEHQLNNFQLLI